MRIAARTLIGIFSLLFATFTIEAQVATGSYPYGTYDNPGPETINVGSLNVHFAIPILAKTGRGGMNLNYSLVNDSSIWTPVGVVGSQTWQPALHWGWSSDTDAVTGVLYYRSTPQKCYDSPPGWYWSTVINNFSYVDSAGISHVFAGTDSDCSSYGSDPLDANATDGSGLTLHASVGGNFSISFPNGATVVPPQNTYTGAAAATDNNGNQISVDASGHFTDTTGNVALTVAGTAGGSAWTQTLTYTDTNGSPQQVKVNYTQETVATSFGCTGIAEFPATSEYLVTSIVLGDGTSTYSFVYEIFNGHYTGRLSTITPPQGGVITYTYPGANDGVNCSDGSTQRLTRAMAATSGSAASTWTYTRTQPNGTGTSHTEVVDGLSNYKEYDFVLPATSTQYTFAPGTYYETNRQLYQGAKTGTPVLAQSTCYNANTSACLTTQMSLPISQIDTSDTFNGAETNGATSKFDSHGDLTESDIYDFGTGGTRGTTVLRSEVWAYGGAFAGLPTSDIVYNGDKINNVVIGKTTYQYDQTATTGPSGAPQHISVTCPCGNLTTKTLYANSSTTYTDTNTYEDTGSLLTSKTTAGSFSGTTTLGYDSTFVYPESKVLPTPSSGVAINYGAGYDTSYTGLLESSADPNSKTSNITSYDEMLRPLQATYPDGGKTTLSFTPTSVTQNTYQSSSVYTTSELQYDAYGRSSRSLISNGQASNPYYQQDVCYDANGYAHVATYRYSGSGASGSNCTTNGDTYAYDVLGRLTKITHADSTTQILKYWERAIQFTDENGVSRITQVDGLGRPTIVCEVYNGAALQGSGSPVSCGTDITGYNGYLTTYAYSVVSSQPQTAVTQGAQTRTFQSDWLGRPTKTIEPESGTATYTYAYNSTGLVVSRIRPRANQTGSTTTTTTTQYDSLGRVTSISYNDGTPPRSYAYDAASEWGVTLQNPVGRLVRAVGDSGYTGIIFGYDPVGRVTYQAQCAPSNCGHGSFRTSAQYDLEGNMTQYVDAFGPTYTYSYSVANEQQSITSSWNSSNYPPGLLSSAAFGPFGPTGWNLGNGTKGARSYDSMGRVIAGSVICNGGTGCTSGSTLYSFSNVGWKGTYVTASSDSVEGQNSSYSYDAFGKLSSTTSTPASFNYLYDRWGNRWNQTVTAGTGPNQTLSFNNNSQVTTSGYTYDAAGNMTNDGVNSYTYDAEGNVTQVSGGQTATYTYDALNRRVRIDSGGNSLEFVYDPQGRHTSEWNVTSSTEQEAWTYWGNAPLSYYYVSSPTTQFDHQDWLGTERARTGVTGGVVGTYASFPFGDGYSNTGNDLNSYHFATLDQDNSANDHAQFREYSNMAGRWFSPDPYQGSYDPYNPQSFNRYAYAFNNPLSFIDPLGLCETEGVTFCINGWAPYPPPPAGGGSGSDPGIPLIRREPGDTGGAAPNNGNQSSWQQKMRQASHYICGTSPADRVVKSVLTGAGIGAITGGFGGFVAGEVFGGEVTFGLTGIPGAYIGAHIGAAVGAVNGLGQGAVLAGICYAGFQYDN